MSDRARSFFVSGKNAECAEIWVRANLSSSSLSPPIGAPLFPEAGCRDPRRQAEQGRDRTVPGELSTRWPQTSAKLRTLDFGIGGMPAVPRAPISDVLS